ncbi:MAG TPA: MFS transporter [Myxococcota bacterium]|jgi:ACS family hexuronate transporter-like MFS transporter|nr:MFS transporter [Myxococcota bacterium]
MHGLTRRQAWALALTATLTMAVSYVDRQTFAVLAPTVTKELGISDSAFGWLVSAFSIAYLVGSPIAGQVIDRVGARRGLLGAVLCWSVVAALHCLVPGFGVLFALRIALGFAEAPSFPGAAQTVHRALPPADRARGFGILFTGSSLGAMVAPLLAVWLSSRFGWRAAFLGTAAVGLVWVPVWLAVAFRRGARAALDAPPSAAPPSHPPPPAELASSTLTPPPPSPFTPAPVSESVSAFDTSAPVPPVPPSTPASPSVGPFELAYHPAVLRAVAVVVASAPILSFLLNWSAKYLVHDMGLTQAQVGGYLWVPPLLFDVGAIGFGHFASVRARAAGHDGAPPRALFAAAAVLAVAGGLIPWARPGGPWAVMVLSGVAMAGGGGLFALLTADMLARVPPGAVSAAGGVTAAAQSLAYIIANPLIGRFVDLQGTYTYVLVALAAWVVPGCALWLAWKPPPAHAARAAPAPSA